MSINSLSQANGATGYGMRITSITHVTGANGYGILFDNVVGNGTTGTAIGIKMGLSIGSTTAIGKFWELDNTQIGASANRTLAMATLSTIRSVNTAITITDNFNVVEWTRSNGATNAGATYNSAGAIVKISNELYSTLTGTLNDTVIPLRIIQHSNGTGAPIAITQNYVISTNFRKLETETNTGHAQWVSNGTSPNGALTGSTGDICYNGDGGKIYYCTGTTNWTSMSGGTATSATLFTQTSDVATSSSTETTLVGSGSGSATLPVNHLTSGKTLKITARGFYNSTGLTLTLRFKFGSTTIVATAATAIPTQGTDATWVAECIITCRTTGASGTVAAQGDFSLLGTTQTRLGMELSSPVTIDTTVTQAVSYTAQWNTTAFSTITCTNLIIESLN